MADKTALQGLPLVEVPARGGVAATQRVELEEYVVTDGLPMADSDVQALTMRDAHSVLDHYFHHVLSDPNVYVAIDTMVHYKRGRLTKHLAPDVMVVLGVPARLRDSYQIWEEGGRAPDFVLEVLSRTTHLNDQGDKRAQYASMGVREYFQYDPKGTTLARRTGRRLLGERLVAGRWERLKRLGEERIWSEVLGLELRVKWREREPGYRELRFRNPRTGKDLRTYSEAEARGDRETARADRAEARGDRETARADRAEARGDRETARADRATERGDREAARADRAEARGDREAARAEAAERENAELKALLAAWEGGGPSNPADGN